MLKRNPPLELALLFLSPLVAPSLEPQSVVSRSRADLRRAGPRDRSEGALEAARNVRLLFEETYETEGVRWSVGVDVVVEESVERAS